jgi:hypothetical protein
MKSFCGVQGRFFQKEPLAAGGIPSITWFCWIQRHLLSLRGQIVRIRLPRKKYQAKKEEGKDQVFYF